MDLSFKIKGSWSEFDNWLKEGFNDSSILSVLKEMGEKGVDALEKNTPKRTGITSQSWSYEIEKNGNGYVLYWTNSNKTKDGDIIALLIQYGHGTGRGGYVVGRDYINPALKPVLDEFSEKLDKVVVGR